MARKNLKVLEYSAIFQEEKSGGYSVWVPALPGCASQGETLEEAERNIKEAIDLYLESEPTIAKLGDEKGARQFLVPIKVHYA